MVLVDTSVWIDHLRNGNSRLEDLLINAEVAIHPHVIGELACGNLKNRSLVLSLLRALPCVPDIEQAEFMLFLEKNRLMGKGLGFVDVHLLASTIVAGTSLWTLDSALRKAGKELGVCYS